MYRESGSNARFVPNPEQKRFTAEGAEVGGKDAEDAEEESSGLGNVKQVRRGVRR